MSVKKDKPYKIYKNSTNTHYIVKDDVFLYYKESPHEENIWVPFKYTVSKDFPACANYMTFIREMSEEELFLELL